MSAGELGGEPEVLIRLDGPVGRITLNRPQVINAVTPGMIAAITTALDAWVTHTDVSMVIMDGAGERGFCAGGDVRQMYESIIMGHPNDTLQFWSDEYQLNAVIAAYPKPIISLMDGVTMGGGVGLAGHSAIRIVTERSRVAMPEARIGFAPDVGGTALLARSPGEVGLHLALTAATMSAADAIYCGFADFQVPSEHLAELIEALRERADPGTPQEVVLLFDDTPEPSSLQDARAWIDECYGAPTVSEILQRLDARPETAAHEAAAVIRSLSPTAVSATLAAVRRARELVTLPEVLEQELLTGAGLLSRPDMREGIRAQVIDKDYAPNWSPATLAEVSSEDVADILAGMPEGRAPEYAYPAAHTPTAHTPTYVYIEPE